MGQPHMDFCTIDGEARREGVRANQQQPRISLQKLCGTVTAPYGTVFKTVFESYPSFKLSYMRVGM